MKVFFWCMEFFDTSKVILDDFLHLKILEVKKFPKNFWLCVHFMIFLFIFQKIHDKNFWILHTYNNFLRFSKWILITFKTSFSKLFYQNLVILKSTVVSFYNLKNLYFPNFKKFTKKIKFECLFLQCQVKISYETLLCSD